MKRVHAIGLIVLFFASVTQSYAHHNLADSYDLKKVVRIEGTLVVFDLRSPHSFVIVQAPDEGNKLRRWSIEWSSSPRLAATGVTSKTLKVGDTVTITAHPSVKQGEYRMAMISLRRNSDDYVWGLGKDEFVE
jgi:hypothetical protein